MSNTLFIGVDTHQKFNAVSLMDGSSGELIAKPFRQPNNLPGTSALALRLDALMRQQHYDTFQLALEAGGWYGWHLLYTLDHHPALAGYPHQLYALNPRLVANFKKTFPDLDHQDYSDATAIADRLRFGRKLPKPFSYEPVYQGLRLLTRYHFHLAHQLSREKTYALALVLLKASEYTNPDKMPFSDPFGTASRFILSEFESLEEVAAKPFEELVELIDQQGKRRFPDPERTTKKLLRVVEESYPLPGELHEPVNLVLRQSLKLITSLEQDLKRLDKAIAARLATIPNTLQTIPGLGPVFVAGIIAELGDPRRFDYDESKVAKFAGFKWRRHQTGEFEAEETPLTRTGNHFLRYYLCEAANLIRLHDEEYRAYYEKKYREATKHAHRRAIVLTARKLIRLVVKLLESQQPYQARRIKSLALEPAAKPPQEAVAAS